MHRQLSTAAAAPGAAVIPGDHMKEGIGLPATAQQATFVGPIRLERGDVLDSVTLGYSTYGRLNAAADNCVVVGHSLTSNSCVDEWWKELIGPGPQYTLDTTKHFIVCANYLGSVYGSSCPLDIHPRTGRRYAADFPVPTVRDNVRVQRLLLDRLGVKSVSMAIGGSLGGMLALEWAATYPELVKTLCLVATCARHTDWAIGVGEVGRQAVYADAKWRDGYYDLADPPLAGMSVARQFAMLSYRTPQSFTEKFKRVQKAGGRQPVELIAQGQGFERAKAAAGAASAASAASSSSSSSTFSSSAALKQVPYYEVEGYLNYQGSKFIKRFDPLCYVRLTQLLDSHDVGSGAGRDGDVTAVLRGLKQPTLVVGIDSDLLYPIDLQHELASSIPRASLYVISSPHGHDSFLIEIKQLNEAIVAWMNGHAYPGLRPAGASAEPVGRPKL